MRVRLHFAPKSTTMSTATKEVVKFVVKRVQLVLQPAPDPSTEQSGLVGTGSVP